MPVIQAYIVEDSAVILDSLIAMLEEMVPVKVVGTADNEATAAIRDDGSSTVKLLKYGVPSRSFGVN